MNNNFSLPLIFEALRKGGFLLGISDYYAVLDALHAGFRYEEDKDVWDKENVMQLCEMLWLKPNQSRFEFRNIFEHGYAESARREAKEVKTEQHPHTSLPQTSTHTNPVNTERSVKEDNTPKSLPVSTKVEKPQGEKFKIKIELTDTSGQEQKISVPDTAKKKRNHFLFTEDYFGVSERQLLNASRLLPIFRTAQNSRQIDLAGTLALWAKNGAFTQLVYQPNQVLCNRVVLLIDHRGSMSAFETLGDKLKQALQDAFKSDEKAAQIYYFYNAPQEYVYLDKEQAEYIATEELLQSMKDKPTLVMVLSDAGAVRGGNSDGRFKATARFLFRLKNAAHQVVWLNPMPKERWNRTTALRIAQFVPMYPLTDASHYQRAINTLKRNQRWK